MNRVKVAPTLACADLMNVARDIFVLDKCGVDTYHVDIMDGVFVPNYCLSWDFIRSIKEITSTPVDIHLMTTSVDRDIDIAVSLGIEGIAFHMEVPGDIGERLKRIKSHGIKAGLAICPETGISALEKYLPTLDYVLLMGVRPGFSGQRFLEETFERLQNLSEVRCNQDLSFEIYVDGGITNEIGGKCTSLGADILVAGKPSIFRTKGMLESLTEEFRKAIEKRMIANTVKIVD